MDPDSIFVILLYLGMLSLTIGSIIGLSGKLWRSKILIALKLLIIGILIGLLSFALYIFDTVETDNVFINRWEIMIFSASLLISLNWSINLTQNSFLKRIKVSKTVKLAGLTLMFTILITTTFYYTANLFDKLNLLGSGG